MGFLGQHVRLTVAAVVLGALIALPLALVARRSRWLAAAVLGASTLVYTIPSLAMFAFVAPVTGLSATTVLVGLVLYSLVILVRNFLAGLQAVPADVREAARGMGYGPGRLLWQGGGAVARPTFGRRPGVWATGPAGCWGRWSCRWPCRRSWPACGSPPSPPSLWSPSG